QRPRPGRGKGEGDDAAQVEGGIVMCEVPAVGERRMRLDGENLAVEHAAPVAVEVEAVARGGAEIVRHQPFRDQMRLGEGAPDLFRRMGEFAFDDDGTGFGCAIHWSILASRSSSLSNRFSQKPAIRLVQSTSGARAPSCA